MRKRIWIPESFTHEVQEPEIICGFEIGIAGYFIVDLIDAKSGEVKEHYEFPNLITDIGLDQIAQGTTIKTLIDHLGVGTSATPPAVSDTALGAEVVRTNDNGGFGSLETDGGPITGSGGPLDTLYWFKRFTRLFFENEANNNLTELGWFNQGSGGTMTVRSLFKDSGGSPIVITKTNADQLRVIYELRIYPPVGVNPPLGNPNSKIDSGTVVLGSTTHSWTGSALAVHNGIWGWNTEGGMLNRTLGSFVVSAGPSGSSILHPTATVGDFPGLVAANTNTLDVYSVGTFRRDVLATWQANTANFGPGGIKILTFRITPGGAGNQHFQLEISESIPKTVAERLRIKYRVTLNRTTT